MQTTFKTTPSLILTSTTTVNPDTIGGTENIITYSSIIILSIALQVILHPDFLPTSMKDSFDLSFNAFSVGPRALQAAFLAGLDPTPIVRRI
ncbi:hypothetical protein CROQUDRAFT_656764 [Cronartium quercuum f. sp. fusiforme G11]|uniref:Uncharacterized protein n=1 Tax=Cronartium quercuum f. sp. fusiforme G11 TaxID=708437 RepID=A0A9P6TDP5_9BASI|nr:hypothetical protein CROQUDRAFT_656764 [Cronartium quercuum f. sp. fusiforme G11]